jgi:hypothetical protein
MDRSFVLLTTPVAGHVIARASYLVRFGFGREPCSMSENETRNAELASACRHKITKPGASAGAVTNNRERPSASYAGINTARPVICPALSLA